jgi:hypothetical protein
MFARKSLGAAVGFLLVAVGGCFNQPKIDAGSLKCATAENCPVGYFCVGVSGVPPRGICVRQASSDGGADASAVADAEVGIGRNDSLLEGGNTSVDVDARDVENDTSIAVEVGADRFPETPEDGNTDSANSLSDSQLPEHPMQTPEAGTDVPITGAGGATGSGGAGGATVVGGHGGASGAGGVTAAGGVVGNGGVGAGGTVSTGGVVGVGGIVGVGGVVASGGAVTSGGVLGAGGLTSTGGTSVTGGITGTGGSSSSGGSVGTGGTTTIKGPCDIYKEIDGQSCVAAHSTARRLVSTYTGHLYQIRVGGSSTGAGGKTAEIDALADGFADSAAQDAACGGASACSISIIYDQSGQGNHLTHTLAGGGAKPGADNEADANALKVTVAGHTVYGVHIHGDPNGNGYRNNNPAGTATADNPETEYAVLSADNFNGGCCFDYGNMETDTHDDNEGAMEAIYFGNCTIWGKGAGTGPWVMADLENGVWAGNTTPLAGNPSVPGTWKYLTAILKGDATGKNHWTIKEANAQSGGLTTAFDGLRPSARYNPMKKQGAIGLGTSGDNSNGGQGNFFEGVMTAHYSSDAADDAVQANIVAVYGQ